MNLKLKTDKNEYPVFSFSLSVFLHITIFIITAVLVNSSIDELKTGAYVQINTIESEPFEEMTMHREKSKSDAKEIMEKQDETNDKEISTEKEKTIEKEKSSEKVNEAVIGNEISFYNFSDSIADTANLVQIYKESTLNVSMKYPAGWTYIDQNVKNKLDGVTFWTNSTIYNPPPYVHIEVQDKDLFNPKRFQHIYKTRNYTVYYNDPEELAGQFNQIIYIRTNTNEDYSLKLIMKGEEAFKSFQPVFFGMVKSFKYGTGYF